jgi:GGDEF domain-containing protein
VGRICQNVVYEHGNADDFVGHVGGDDFVVLTTPDRVNTLCMHVTTRYKEESVALYSPEDLRSGSISGIDREGRPYQFPLVSLSIGVVNNQIYMPHSIQEVSYLAAEAKRYAKRSTSNISCISSQYDKANTEYLSSATSSSPFLFWPSFSSATYTHAFHDLLPLAEDNILAEYEVS